MNNRRLNVLICLFAVLLFAAAPAACAGGPMDDTRMEKMGDWFSALGKSGGEKKQILLQRRIQRRSAKAQNAGREAARSNEKNARKRAQDAGKAARKAQNK